MVQTEALEQTPAPGVRQLHFAGDTVTFTLTAPVSWNGEAWLRTTLGHVYSVRREVVRQVEHGENPLGRGWYDIPMTPVGRGCFSLTIPLTEVGHFEAKSYFLTPDGPDPLWPPGANTVVNIAPAVSCCANILYNAFVRQFGPNKNGEMGSVDGDVKHLDEAGYTVIPPSGTFRDLIGELDFIIDHLGCRIVQLLPIHPTPTTYARMGRFGSPYAALSFTAVDPALAEFDPKATPLEQFIELVDAVHAKGARLFIDIAINHTGWAAGLHESHPHWLSREADGQIENPGAWGVVWADLTRLDYSQKALWRYMADVFLTWCRRGVDGFRCDAGYMIPEAAWQYMIAKVRTQFPDVIFLLEGLGGKISVTRDLLNKSDFNWAYSELFQNYDRSQIEHYLPEAMEISKADGTTIHFAETHDNLRLAATSATYARMRTALCALLSEQGGFGFANGVEWLATEKINVHDAPSLNWGAPKNLVGHLRRLNAILTTHPAFFHPVQVKMIQQGASNVIVAARRCLPDMNGLLIIVNLDAASSAVALWKKSDSPITGATAIDLLSGKNTAFEQDGENLSISLLPGQACCFSDQTEYLNPTLKAENQFARHPDRIRRQWLYAKALETWRFYNGSRDLGDWDLDGAAEGLSTSPLKFLKSMNTQSTSQRTIVWRYPVDLRREVMIPPGYFLFVNADSPFRASVIGNGRTLAVEESITVSDGTAFALFYPQPISGRHKKRHLKLSVYETAKYTHHEAPLLYLTSAENVHVRKIFVRPKKKLSTLHMLGTNRRGGMAMGHAHWNLLPSRYDSLLAANLSRTVPEDRRILFTRLRGWIVFQGFSQEIGPDCLDAFGFDFDSWGAWSYHIPSGQGQHIVLSVGFMMIPEENAFKMAFYRHTEAEGKNRLADDRPVTLILRPDIEDRNFHESTKAYAGAETYFPFSVTAGNNGFRFHPSTDHFLDVSAQKAMFTVEPEWQYMVNRSKEAQRGQDPNSDLFSPGYFSGALTGGTCEILTAHVRTKEDGKLSFPVGLEKRIRHFFNLSSPREPPVPALTKALDQYIVRRDQYATVIAGYPWFLDWGRDTLIVVRGIIAAGRHEEARAIIQQFAAFEKDGTIPNMIRGGDTGNRDTSDAPLWLFRVCDELGAVMGQEKLLQTDCQGRSLIAVLRTISESIEVGTPNGIAMDSDSGLVFSPAHFTWMDTNYPAGTPRQGYPIEIQALWWAALDYLGRKDAIQGKKWQKLSEKVKASIGEFFYLDGQGYLSDCLHADAGTPARQAIADNALRPNQLFALTLGAVTDRVIAEDVLFACSELLVPGAIRSLADRPLSSPLPVYHNGKLVNNPNEPYMGVYAGDEDTSRKPAYHNGTAWTWVFPSFCEAWVGCYGTAEVETALAWLASSSLLINDGCVGHIPEILDGDAPHKSRGCDAQAWGVSELLRVWIKLESQTHFNPYGGVL